MNYEFMNQVMKLVAPICAVGAVLLAAALVLLFR